MTVNQANACLGLLREIPVITDDAADLQTVVGLARSRRLTVYDAVYLELAARHSAPLATLDSESTRAAAAIGLSLVR